jgi:hypothetical protein
MSLKNLALFAIVAALLATTVPAKAQFHSGFYTPRYGSYVGFDPIATARKKPFQRYAVGLTYAPFSGTVSFTTIDEFGITDSIKSMDIKGSGGGVLYAIIVPCARLGNRSLAAIHIGINGNYYSIKLDEITIKRQSAFYDGSVTLSGGGAGFMFGFPVGVDLITGGEATLDRADRFSFTVGAGVFPLMGVAIVNQFAGVNFKAPPYVKAEVGFHFGINWKLRATYVTKSALSFTENDESLFSDGSTVQTSLKSNDHFMLSLMIQPFSFGWE